MKGVPKVFITLAGDSHVLPPLFYRSGGMPYLGTNITLFSPAIFCETYVHIPGGAKVAVACVGRGRGSICIIVLGAYVTPKAE